MANSLKFVFIALALALLAAIATCSLAPSPNMREMAWIPSWIGEWADRNPNFRNMPVFAALSALLFFVVTLYQPLVTRHGRWRIAIGAFVATGLLGVLLVVAQLLLPHRWADWLDIFWSVAGAFFGALVAWILARLAPVS